MKIYFAGSIRGGRGEKDKQAAKIIIDILSKFGTVLTEHIGRKDLSFLGEELTDSEIYQRDIAWLREADLVVAEVSKPSLGVGYEIGVSEALGKEIICLYRDSNISAMIQGNSNLIILEYDFENLKEKITDLMIHYIGGDLHDGKN